jgi:hypothetical protein
MEQLSVTVTGLKMLPTCMDTQPEGTLDFLESIGTYSRRGPQRKTSCLLPSARHESLTKGLEFLAVCI